MRIILINYGVITSLWITQAQLKQTLTAHTDFQYKLKISALIVKHSLRKVILYISTMRNNNTVYAAHVMAS